MTNEEILKLLSEFNGSDNAKACIEYLPQYDLSEGYPVNKIMETVKLNQWSREDFNMNTEIALSILPNWMKKVYEDVKLFISNRGNKLVETEIVYATMLMLPIETQEQKNFIVYKTSFDNNYNQFLNTPTEKEETEEEKEQAILNFLKTFK